MDQEQASLLYLASLELSDSELMNTTENKHDVNNKPEKKRRSLIRLGVNPDQAFMWSRSRMGSWAVAQSPILGTTITVDRLKRRGYIPFSEMYKIVSLQFNEPLYT